MSVLGVIQLILLAALSFSVLSGCLASAAVGWVLALTRAWSPERRHRALLLLSVAPLALAMCGVLAVLAPSVLAFGWPEYDHCLRHADHHVHLCFVHLPHHAGNASSWLVLILAAGWLSARTGRALLQLYRAAECAAQLRAHAHGAPGLGAQVLPTATPLCFLAGLLEPTLFLSQGLLDEIGPEEASVIVHHERAHAARRDILLRLLARAATALLWPSARARLLGELELSAEQSCDEVAAQRAGGRLQVAATILKVERLLQATSRGLAPLAIAFGGDTVPARVEALLGAEKRSGSVVALPLGLGLSACAILAASAPLHHLTESLLGALTH